MCTEPFEQKNICLDQILAERRSYRMFTPEIPPRDAVDRILYAGLLAPYAAAAVGTSNDYFRRFFVLKNGSASMDAAIPLVRAQIDAMSLGLEAEMEKNPESTGTGDFICTAPLGNP